VEGVQHKDLIKVLTREDSHHSAGVGEVGHDGGLVVQFMDIEVDETRRAAVMGWRDTKDNRDERRVGVGEPGKNT